MKLEDKIRAFAENPENQTAALAMLKVGREKGDPFEIIARNLIASLLFKFHGIPIQPPTGN